MNRNIILISGIPAEPRDQSLTCKLMCSFIVYDCLHLKMPVEEVGRRAKEETTANDRRGDDALKRDEYTKNVLKLKRNKVNS